MKKILFVCTLVFMSGMAFGQTKKACCKGKKACTKTASAQVQSLDGTTVVASALAEAELAAEQNENIEKRVCSQSGKVSFHEKSVCSQSGKVSYSAVNFDGASKTFVKAASMEAGTQPMIKSLDEAPTPVSAKTSCTKAEKAACAKKCTKAEKAACAKKCAAKKGA